MLHISASRWLIVMGLNQIHTEMLEMSMHSANSQGAFECANTCMSMREHHIDWFIFLCLDWFTPLVLSKQIKTSITVII